MLFRKQIYFEFPLLTLQRLFIFKHCFKLIISVNRKAVGILLILSLALHQLVKAQNGRYSGMGDASVMLSDFWSAFGNQAGLASITVPEAGICYYNQYLMWETGTQTGAYVLPTQSGNFAASFSRYGYSLYSENNIGLAYARNFGSIWSASLQFDYLFYNQSDDYGNQGAFLFELGIITKPIENLSIGAHLYNPARAKLSNYQNERVPTVMRFGLGYQFDEWVLVTLETEKDLEQKARVKCGLEYQPVTSLFLRAGVLTQPNQFSLGMGYTIQNFTTDFSFVTHESLPISSQLSFKYTFN